MDPLINCGQIAPLFTLPDLVGNLCSLEGERGRTVILNFWSAECPWAERADELLLSGLEEWGEEVTLWSIASNANESGKLLANVASQRGLPLVLRDRDREVADLYGAQTTPHLFVIDAMGFLRYQGAPDDITFRQRTASQFYLDQCVQAILAGKQPEPEQTPPYGCTIVRFIA